MPTTMKSFTGDKEKTISKSSDSNSSKKSFTGNKEKKLFKSSDISSKVIIQ